MSRLCLVVVLGLSMVLGGCGESKQSDIGESCTKTDDCAGTARCVGNVCVTPQDDALKAKENRKAKAAADKKKKERDRKYCMGPVIMPNPIIRYRQGGLAGVEKSRKKFTAMEYSFGEMFYGQARIAGYVNKTQGGNLVGWQGRYPDCVDDGVGCLNGFMGHRMRVWPCKELGLCGRDSDGNCVAVADEDCASSKICEKYGDCTREGNYCVVGSDQDCATSQGCKKHKRCKRELGEESRNARGEPAGRLYSCVKE